MSSRDDIAAEAELIDTLAGAFRQLSAAGWPAVLQHPGKRLERLRPALELKQGLPALVPHLIQHVIRCAEVQHDLEVAQRSFGVAGLTRLASEIERAGADVPA